MAAKINNTVGISEIVNYFFLNNFNVFGVLHLRDNAVDVAVQWHLLEVQIYVISESFYLGGTVAGADQPFDSFFSRFRAEFLAVEDF